MQNRTRSIGISSASAAICAMMVSMPCPIADDPTSTANGPSRSTSMRAFSLGPERAAFDEAGDADAVVAAVDQLAAEVRFRSSPPRATQRSKVLV